MIARIDSISFGIWSLLIVLGIVAVSSATLHLTTVEPNPFFLRHVFYVIVSIAVFVLLLMVPTSVVLKFHRVFYLLTLVLSAIVIVPFIGIEAGGGRRWLDLQFMTLQVSELARLLIPIYVAGHLALHREAIQKSTYAAAKPLFWVLLVVGLTALQPDFGSAVLIGLVVGGMMFLAGVRMRDVICTAVVALPVFAYFIYHRRDRIMAWLDPWQHAAGEGYQSTQSFIAFGRGEFTGLGLGDGVQKVLYLPTPHNDFIFSVIVEEVGFIGGTLVLLVLMALVARCFWIGRQALRENHDFCGFLAFGAGLMLGFQTLINVGVAMGALPTKGLTLPFVSYGGNSLLVSSALVALVCRAHMEINSPDLSRAER